MKRHIKWWIIPIALILAVSIGCAMFWATIKIYLAPKTVLAAALTDTYSALEERFHNSPVLMIAQTLDVQNGNHMAMELTGDNKLLGTVQYDMDIQARWHPRQFAAQGQVITQEKTMDLSMYLDRDFAAFSSTGMLGGKFYGLTYNTFSQDIRSNQLLSLMISDATLREWEAQIRQLQNFMQESYPLPEFSGEDFKYILMGIQALRADVDREWMETENGKEQFYVISFETTGKTIRSGLNLLDTALPVTIDPEEEIAFSFWLKEESLARIQLEADEREVALSFGQDAATDDLFLRYEDQAGIQTIRIQTRQDASVYQETVELTGIKNAAYSYSWDFAHGNFHATQNQEGEEHTISGILTSAENGFHLETEDFEAMMHLLLGTKDSGNNPCTVMVTKGAEITTPEYQNFNTWSIEDLITIFTGIGR